MNRREALTLCLAAAGTLVRPLRAAELLSAVSQSSATPTTQSAAPATQPGAAPAAAGSRLVIRNARPLDAESPIDALRTFETPNDLFFVRAHHAQLPTAGSPPETVRVTRVTPWPLTIDGEVVHPVTIQLEEIRRMRAEHRTVTIECAGNGRGRFELPATSGVQWQLGAVSTATWTGVPLSALLERAGVQTSAQHFWMEGADRPSLPAAPIFLRSIPRETALGEAFVAYEMNGQPIPLLHGGPLRLIVPLWFGMASTKWFTHVHARTTESDNHFMARGYRYGDNSPVDLMRVKSLITTPRDDDRVRVGTTRVTGVAWTGTGTVLQVEISNDGGQTWQPARFTSESKPGVWRMWEANVAVKSGGDQRVRARATDSAGHTQPEKAAPNPGGYGNNSIHEVRFHAS
jgi:DMSO/TMAO reductase YedYZ molybdopterin-dependent catalytic subunit